MQFTNPFKICVCLQYEWWVFPFVRLPHATRERNNKIYSWVKKKFRKFYSIAVRAVLAKLYFDIRIDVRFPDLVREKIYHRRKIFLDNVTTIFVFFLFVVLRNVSCSFRTNLVCTIREARNWNRTENFSYSSQWISLSVWNSSALY